MKLAYIYYYQQYAQHYGPSMVHLDIPGANQYTNRRAGFAQKLLNELSRF